VTRLWAGLSEFDSQQVQGFFSLPYHILTGSGTHPASCPVDTRDSYPRVMWLGHEPDLSPPSSKNAWSYTSSLPYILMTWCLVKYKICLPGMVQYLVKCRESYTFYS